MDRFLHRQAAGRRRLVYPHICLYGDSADGGEPGTLSAFGKAGESYGGGKARPGGNCVSQEGGDQVTFRVYDVQDEAAAEIYDMDQNKVASIVVKRIEDKLVIDCDNKKPFTVELVNTGILDVKGAKASKENKNTTLRDCESHIECIQ